MNSCHRRYSRRRFLRQTAAGTAALTIVPRHVLGQQDQPAANDKLNIAGIGVGGQGHSDLQNVHKHGGNIVALCDVDDRRGAASYEKYPKAKRFRDFRKMLDQLDDRIDAVVVATPDHTHAVASLDVLGRGKHLYCEKPLAHSIYEVRQVMQAARKAGVVTQLGNQGHSSKTIRSFCEWIWDGAIGNVQEVHASCDAFKDVYCQIDKLPQLQQKHDVPPELDWDLWLGPAANRPYHPVYLPFNWRGWLPFGTGAIGDWVCHVVDPAFWALDLDAPTSVTAEVEGYDPAKHADVYPRGVAVTYEFPAKGDRGPVKLVWYDGNKGPPRPKDLEEGRKTAGTGAIVVGDQGTITHGSHGAGGVRIIPDEKMRQYEFPQETLPRVPQSSHQLDWLQAIREGRKAGSDFDYGGPLTEIGLLGVIAVKFPDTQLQWDSSNMRFSNCDAANGFVQPQFREEWNI